MKRSVLALAAVACGVFLWSEWCVAPDVHWNGMRLAPSFAIARGINPYTDPVSMAPLLDWTYGPVLPLALLPVTSLPTLAWAYVGALALQTLAVLAPIAVLLRSLGMSPLACAFGTVLAVGLLSLDPATGAFWSGLHVDTFALGLMLVSIACVLRTPPSRSYLHVAAACAAAAMFSKQTAVPIVLIGPLLEWHRAGFRNAIAHAVRIVAYSVTFAVLCAASFGGWWRMIFNLWIVPSQQAVLSRSWLDLQLRVWLRKQWYLAGVLAAGWLCSGRGWPAPRSALACLVAAMALVPTALPAMAKVGGWLNSFHPAYFWSAFCVAVTTHGVAAGSRPRWLRTSVGVVLLLSVPTALVLSRPLSSRFRPSPTEDLVATFVRSHDGRVWLPWNPVVNLAVSGWAAPTEDAIWSLGVAGLRPPEATIRGAVPPRIDTMLCAGTLGRCIPPEFRDFVPTGEYLHGYAVFRRRGP
jgi:hypothetical protein